MFKKIFITTVLITILLPIGVLAQELQGDEKASPSITIAPSILDLDVSRSQTLEKKISIKNDADIPIPVKVEINDYSQNEYGIPDYSLDSSDWSPKQWLVIEPADFILESYGVREVTVKITIPEYAQPGSHFATILFKPVLPPEYFEADSAHVIPYIGAIVALNVKGEGLEGEKEYLKIQEFVKQETNEEEDEEFFSQVNNDDVYYHKVSGNIVVRNILGKEVAFKSVDEVTIFPKKARSLTSLLEHDLSFGRYKAELHLSDGNEEVVKSITFWEKPTIGEIILIILYASLSLIIMGTSIFVIKNRRNLKKAIKVLFINRK